jgi:predicted peroxiredoxin
VSAQDVPPVRGLAILLWGVDPLEPERCATPFMHAAAAAALDLEVEVHFSARAVLLLRKGQSDRLHAAADACRSILEFMRQGHEHGAQFVVCPAALAAQGLVRAVDPAWRAQVF